jgi:hypothetical protein
MLRLMVEVTRLWTNGMEVQSSTRERLARPETGPG